MLKAVLISVLIFSCSGSGGSLAAEGDPRRGYSMEELGINLKEHPDSPSFDFSAPSSQRDGEPLVLQGKVATHIESVDMAGHGPYVVEVASGLNLVDRKRKKLIKLEICYPKEAGSYPVLIYSHAPIASARDYRPLSAFYASHGFISIMPTHDDALVLHMKPGNQGDEKVSVFKLLKLAKTSKKELSGREEDIAKVLDSISQLPSKIDGLNGKIETKKIALVGHHAGAYSCELLTGVEINGHHKSKVADPRISAQLLFTGLNKALPPIGKQDWSQVKVPTMVVSFFDGIRAVDKQRKETLSVLNQAKDASSYLLTIDSATRKKTSRKRIRKIIRDSNVELISFRPLAFLRSKKSGASQAQKTDSESINLNTPDYDEMPGSQLMNILGVSPLDKHSDERERFEFAMGATLPFLNAYLKGSKDDLETIRKPSEKTYDSKIHVKLNPVHIFSEENEQNLPGQ